MFYLDDELEKYIETKMSYPELTRGELFSLFPNFEDLEKNPKVRLKIAEQKIKEAKEARVRSLSQELSEAKRREKIRAQKERALEVIDEALYHDDISVRFKAAIKTLGREYARESKLGELEAQKEIGAQNSDDSYPEPSGSDEPMDESGEV